MKKVRAETLTPKNEEMRQKPHRSCVRDVPEVVVELQRDRTSLRRREEEGKELAESSEKLSPMKRARETAAVKIRTKDGIDFAWFRAKTGYDFLSLEGKVLSEAK